MATCTRTRTRQTNLAGGRSAPSLEMSKVVLENKDPRTRAQQRQKLGTLKQLTVQPATRARYDKAIDAFLKFLTSNKLQLPYQRERIDSLAAEYLEHLWCTGAGRGLASDTLAALQDQDPRLRGLLQTSWRLLKTWHSHEIPSRAPPFPEFILQCLVGWSLFQEHFSFAVSLMVGFYGMLRTGELLTLKKEHFSLSVATGVAVISLGYTKGGKRMGAMESVTLTHVTAISYLKQWLQLALPGQSLCKTPVCMAKDVFRLQQLKLHSFEFRPYSLRRGGATWYFTKFSSLDRVMVMGRWQAARTARIYLNEGQAALADMHFTPQRVHLNPFHRTFLNTNPLKHQTLEPPRGSAGGRGKRSKRSKPQKKDKKRKPKKAKSHRK